MKEALDELIAVLRSLNTIAAIHPISGGEIALERILGTGLFSLERAANAPGWLKELRGEHKPETEEYGGSSCAYRARSPFHPQRFHDFLKADWDNGRLLRAKGYFWNAARVTDIGSISQAGSLIRHGYIGRWWRFIPKSHWPEDAYRRDAIMEKWDGAGGDCRQELVFIGQGIDRDKLFATLDACLLTVQEIEQGLEAWAALPDPLGDGTARQVPQPRGPDERHGLALAAAAGVRLQRIRGKSNWKGCKHERHRQAQGLF